MLDETMTVSGHQLFCIPELGISPSTGGPYQRRIFLEQPSCLGDLTSLVCVTAIFVAFLLSWILIRPIYRALLCSCYMLLFDQEKLFDFRAAQCQV